MKKTLLIVAVLSLVVSAHADRPRVSTTTPVIVRPITISWEAFHHGSWAEASAHMATKNGDAALVHTGDPDYPYVVIEKWGCGGCFRSPDALYMVEPQTGGYMPIGGKFKVATGPDGTALLVWRK